MAAWPQVKRRLVDILPTLPGWSGVTVFDGPRVSQDFPTDFITVGFVEGEDFAGSYEQARPEAWDVEESGTIRSELITTSGDVDLEETEDRVFDLVDAWEQWVTKDPTLGVLSPSSTASLAVDVQPVQNQNGSAQRLTVTLTYTARY